MRTTHNLQAAVEHVQQQGMTILQPRRCHEDAPAEQRASPLQHTAAYRHTRMPAMQYSTCFKQQARKHEWQAQLPCDIVPHNTCHGTQSVRNPRCLHI
jgi:hypothetical protein